MANDTVFFLYKDANTNSNQCAYCVPSNFLSTCCELTLHVLVHLPLTSVLQMGKLRKEVSSLFQGHTASKAMVGSQSRSSVTGASWLPNYAARKFYFQNRCTLIRNETWWEKIFSRTSG